MCVRVCAGQRWRAAAAARQWGPRWQGGGGRGGLCAFSFSKTTFAESNCHLSAHIHREGDPQLSANGPSPAGLHRATFTETFTAVRKQPFAERMPVLNESAESCSESRRSRPATCRVVAAVSSIGMAALPYITYAYVRALVHGANDAHVNGSGHFSIHPSMYTLCIYRPKNQTEEIDHRIRGRDRGRSFTVGANPFSAWLRSTPNSDVDVAAPACTAPCFQRARCKRRPRRAKRRTLVKRLRR
jgi:hypothetical protein